MGPNNIRLGSGTLYFQTEGGLEPLGEIGEAVELEFAEDAEPILRMGVEEVTLSLEMVGEAAMAAAESLARLAQDFAVAVGFCCSNRRVAHLIRYGSTRRIRKKNLARALKIAAKEAKR